MDIPNDSLGLEDLSLTDRILLEILYWHLPVATEPKFARERLRSVGLTERQIKELTVYENPRN